ncbi:MAG: nitroreductase family protein [Oscillospiraceae bacterium]|jgi:nitroreductase
MEIIPAIQNRCSTRKFESRPVEEEKLNLIIEAARMAPSGKNERGNRIYVFENREVLERINQALVEAVLNGNAVGMGPESAKLVQKDDFSFCYNAPVFILTTYVKDPYNAYVNCGCLLENAMLQACELGIGSCFINMIRRAENDPSLRKLLKEYGVGESEIITGGLALGYPATPFTKNSKTEGNEVIRIR